ncbi:MAG: 3-isopropylmalate dehydratase large subunit [Oscillospiraceae bacterium]|jgi:3-isopropylmalate/(R)-2-methylmalate dehydratase large subunit|nr:3-isopropylmalate dehydratase large subunit [Oscillospiraceae bacterium]
MGMTATQKILAAHAGVAQVEAGQLLEVPLDLVMGNDITAPVAIREMERAGLFQVFDPQKIALVLDHFTPNKDIAAARQSAEARAFARKHGITHFYDVGAMGIEHVLLPEAGLIAPGEVVIGADSHTCTYGALGAFSTGVGSTDMAAGMARGTAWFKVPRAIRVTLTGAPGAYIGGKDVILHLIGLLGVDGASYQSLEFVGPGVGALTMDDRFTIANMAIECGAKNGLFPVDARTEEYLQGRVTRPWTDYAPDGDAVYDREVVLDLSALASQVACPHLPSNVKPAADLGDVVIDQVVIGSCTNGRMEDMRAAASVLRGRRVADGVRCIVIPGSQAVYRQSLEEGLLAVFVDAGAAVSTPTCGPCLGGHMGILAEGEKCVSTTNRNFVGRMGHVSSEVYLAGPGVAAASAVTGRVTTPAAIDN